MHAFTIVILCFAAVLVVGLAVIALSRPLHIPLAIGDAAEVISVVVGFILFCTLVVWFIAGAEQRGCHTKADDLGREATWGYFGDCRVKTDDGYVPLDNLRITNEEGE